MRLMSFVQVLLLLLLAAYAVLFALENPGFTAFPLPFGRDAISLPTGLSSLLWMGAGMLMTTLLLLPVIVQQGRFRRRAARSRDEAEARLAATLQARLSATPTHVPGVTEGPPSANQMENAVNPGTSGRPTGAQE